MSSGKIIPTSATLAAALRELPTRDTSFATRFVELLLPGAVGNLASDIHLQPTADSLDITWRLDGVLQPLGSFPRGAASDVVTRLKVLADLLTYRTDTPQEGRLRVAADGVEMRLSTFPTLHGERAVVRLFSAAQRLHYFAELGLPQKVVAELSQLLQETSGLILVTGPAGSGKTTTLYAALREMASAANGTRSLLSIEDPIEVAVPGVSQSQVNAVAGFDLATALRSVLRQDPEVLMVGEIRDRTVAEGVLGAALTGHLVLSTFHAGSAAAAISRLSDMGIEPYLLRSGVLAVLHQRLVRRLCECSRPAANDEERLGLPVAKAKVQVGCPRCLHTGYHGRLVITELLSPRADALGRAILSREDATTLERFACQTGMITRWQNALAAVEAGDTSPAEIRRVFGFAMKP